MAPKTVRWSCRCCSAELSLVFSLSWRDVAAPLQYLPVPRILKRHVASEIRAKPPRQFFFLPGGRIRNPRPAPINHRPPFRLPFPPSNSSGIVLNTASVASFENSRSSASYVQSSSLRFWFSVFSWVFSARRASSAVRFLLHASPVSRSVRALLAPVARFSAFRFELFGRLSQPRLNREGRRSGGVVAGRGRGRLLHSDTGR